MTSFAINVSSITAQTLINGETGVIGPSGTLVVTGPEAVGVVGNTKLAVYGALTSLDGDAVRGPAASIFDMVVGATGQLTSWGDAVIDVSSTISASLRNNGLISGTGAGVIMNTADSAATIRLTNTGIVESMGSAIILGAGSGSVWIVNTGTILAGNLPGRYGISASGQTVVLQQSGDVTGQVRLGASSGATLTNTGLIDGDIFLGLGNSNDTFRNLGGTVTGMIFGGSGDDTYIIDSDDLVLSDLSGTDTVNSSVSYQLQSGFEVLNLTGNADLNGNGSNGDNTITGNVGNNLLRGFAGDDILDGGRGDDTLTGGSDNDTLVFSDGEDVLFGGNGTDTLLILTRVASEGVFVNLTTLTVRLGDIGNPLTTIDLFEVVEADFGNDKLTGSEFGDQMHGDSGNDVIRGRGGADYLDGGDSRDTIFGEDGNDTIVGGSFGDRMFGGAGADVFLFNTLSDSKRLSDDNIRDFDGTTDKIDLSAIDANGAAAGNGTFVFGGANFRAEGIASIRVTVVGTATYIEIRDTNGAASDMLIELSGTPTLTATDFLL